VIPLSFREVERKLKAAGFSVVALKRKPCEVRQANRQRTSHCHRAQASRTCRGNYSEHSSTGGYFSRRVARNVEDLVRHGTDSQGRRNGTGSVSDLNLGRHPLIEVQVAHAPRTVPWPHGYVNPPHPVRPLLQ